MCITNINKYLAYFSLEDKRYPIQLLSEGILNHIILKQALYAVKNDNSMKIVRNDVSGVRG